MLNSTASRLLQFLLSLVLRLRRSLGHIALALRVRFASLWRSILAVALARHNDRLHAHDVPVTEDSPMREHSHGLQSAEREKEASRTLAALPVRRDVRWQDVLSRYWDPSSSNHFKPDPVAATPEGASQRYKPKKVVSQSPKSLSIPAGQHTLLHPLPPLPDGWKHYIHPEGSVLFHHEGLRLFTESNVTHHEKEIIFYATTLVQLAIQNDDVTLDELTEVVLNVDEKGSWCYYFVDHTNRLLFWVHPVNSLDDLGVNLQGNTLLRPGTGMLLPAIFWCSVCDMDTRTHCEFYPHNRTLPGEVSEELRGMLNYAKTDIITANLSTCPFAQDELTVISDLVNSLIGAEISDPYNIWVIARLMSQFTENQFLNFCGQPGARLNADTPLFGRQTWNHSRLFKVVNVLLFGSLNEHGIRLQRLWVDGIIIQPRWKSFISRLTNELSRYTLFSTVMLAVNISFLAVPGVVATNPPGPASAIQIIIYCSVVSTIGSIIFSFALMNVYSDPGLMAASAAAEVMKTLNQIALGMPCLAFMHSLPIACLVWSIVLFAAALALQIFLPHELPTVVTLGVECGILALSGLMSMIVTWLYSENEREDVAGPDTDPEHNPLVRSQDVEQGPEE